MVLSCPGLSCPVLSWLVLPEGRSWLVAEGEERGEACSGVEWRREGVLRKKERSDLLFIFWTLDGRTNGHCALVASLRLCFLRPLVSSRSSLDTARPPA